MGQEIRDIDLSTGTYENLTTARPAQFNAGLVLGATMTALVGGRIRRTASQKRHAAVGFPRMIEAWRSLPEQSTAIRPSFIDAWPRLPDSLKAAILAIVDAAGYWSLGRLPFCVSVAPATVAAVTRNLVP